MATGRNAWREYVVSEWAAADQAWREACESEALGYASETHDFREANPRPMLRDFMVNLSQSA